MVSADMAPAQEICPTNNSPRRPRVLAVDDQPDTLKVIQLRLQHAGMDCETRSNGPSALEFLKRETVDAIVLDVRMPDMDGYQVCRQIKADPRTQDVPVLFLTSNNMPEEKMLGFQAGAHDYLTKPVNKLELQARVHAALRVKQLQDQLKERIRQEKEQFQQQLLMQQKINQLRQGMLSAHWQKMFSQLATSIAHEINNPLTAAVVSMDLTLAGDSLSEESHRRLDIAETCLHRAGERLRQLLFVARPADQEETVQLDQIVNDLAALVNYEQMRHNVALSLQLEPNCRWRGRAGELARALLYIINNAIEAVSDRRDGRVGIALSRQAEHYRIAVSDNGPGLSDAVRPRLFEPFFTTKSAPHTGVGLYLAQGIIKNHGGVIRFESPDTAGCTSFVVELSY